MRPRSWRSCATCGAVRQDGGDGEARRARRAVRRRDPSPRQGPVDRTVRRSRGVSWSAFLWAQPHAQSRCAPAHGRRDRACIALVCFLATMPDGMNRILDRFANTRGSWCTTRPASSIRCPTPTCRRCARCRAWSRSRAGPGSRRVPGKEGVSFPKFGSSPMPSPSLAELRIAPQALEEFKRRRDAAIVGPRHARAPTDGRSATGHLEGHVFPVDLTFKIVGEIPASARRTSGSSANISSRRSPRRGHFDFLGTIWVRYRRSRAPRSADEADRRYVPQQRAQRQARARRAISRTSSAPLEGLVFLIHTRHRARRVCIVSSPRTPRALTCASGMREIGS